MEPRLTMTENLYSAKQAIFTSGSTIQFPLFANSPYAILLICVAVESKHFQRSFHTSIINLSGHAAAQNSMKCNLVYHCRPACCYEVVALMTNFLLVT